MDTVKQINSPYDNAAAIFDYTNTQLNDNNIKDSTGTQIAQLEQNPANPAWLFALGCGSLHTAWQERLAKAYACLDPQNCEEDQVLVLAMLAGIKRGNGTPSHIMANFTNTTDNQTIDIPAGAIFKDGQSGNDWVLDFPVSLSPQTTALRVLYCTVDGPVSVDKGAVFTSEQYPDILCDSYDAAVPGNSIETIASLRNRISSGIMNVDPYMSVQAAIEMLPGIESCSIWFNQNLQNSIFIGPDGAKQEIKPRCAYVSVKGMDATGKLAETYYSYMNCPTTPLDDQDPSVTTETFQRGQQPLTMQFQRAEAVKVYVTIYIVDAQPGAQAGIEGEVIKHSGTLRVGENLTAQQVSEWIQNLGYGKIEGCYVGNAANSSLLSTNIRPDQYCIFDYDSVTVSARGA